MPEVETPRMITNCIQIILTGPRPYTVRIDILTQVYFLIKIDFGAILPSQPAIVPLKRQYKHFGQITHLQNLVVKRLLAALGVLTGRVPLELVIFEELVKQLKCGEA